MYVYAMILVDKADKCNFSSIISHVMSIFVFKRLFKLIVKVIIYAYINAYIIDL